MAGLILDERNMQIIPIHYDVGFDGKDFHSLRLETFIIAAESVEKIAKEFGEYYFGNKIQFEIHILPPEDGSFLKRLLLLAKEHPILAGASAMLGTSLVDATLLEFTQKDLTQTLQSGIHQARVVVEKTIDDWDTKKAEFVVTESVKAFLQIGDAGSRDCIINVETFPKAFSARNKFYEECYKNENIRAIGFTEEHEFPIQREAFSKFIVNIPEKDDDDFEWQVEITHINVTSPDWERGRNRNWKGRSDKESEVAFIIEDDNFWGLVNSKKLKVKIKDVIKVQWAFVFQGTKKTKIQVLRVLEYNGAKVSEPLTDEEIGKIFKKNNKVESLQHELFE